MSLPAESGVAIEKKFFFYPNAYIHTKEPFAAFRRKKRLEPSLKSDRPLVRACTTADNPRWWNQFDRAAEPDARVHWLRRWRI